MDSFFWKIKLKNQNQKNFVYFFEKLSQLKFFYRKKIEMLFENHNSYFSM